MNAWHHYVCRSYVFVLYKAEKKKSATVCDTLYRVKRYMYYCSALRFVRWMASDIAGIERMIRVMTASAPM